MNYEEKYNEALERATKLHEGLKGYNANREVIENIFPELAESEDERIRKQLIGAIKIGRSNSGISFTEEAASRYIAWLEKQKDLTTENIYKHNRERMSFWNGQQKEHKLTATIDGEPIPTENQSVGIPLAGWSEEDEKMLSDLRNTLGCLMNAGAITFKTKKKFSNWLKSLRPSWKPSEEQMKALQNAVALTACDKELARLYNQLKKL